MADDGYYVEERGPGEWAVVREGAPTAAATFATKADALAYRNELTEMCVPQMGSENSSWEKLAKNCW
jgi:hypothetical protein